MKIRCHHLETKARGIIKEAMHGNKKFPDQYGIYWTKKANYGKFGAHYYWNDKDKIKILNDWEIFKDWIIDIWNKLKDI